MKTLKNYIEKIKELNYNNQLDRKYVEKEQQEYERRIAEPLERIKKNKEKIDAIGYKKLSANVQDVVEEFANVIGEPVDDLRVKVQYCNSFSTYVGTEDLQRIFAYSNDICLHLFICSRKHDNIGTLISALGQPNDIQLDGKTLIEHIVAYPNGADGVCMRLNNVDKLVLNFRLDNLFKINENGEIIYKSKYAPCVIKAIENKEKFLENEKEQ